MDTSSMLDSEWLKLNVNVKHNDMVKFLDEGVIENPDDPKKRRMNIGVEVHRDGNIISEKKMTLNKTNLIVVQKLYGMDSKNWIGKFMVVNATTVRNPQTNSMVPGIALSNPNAGVAN